MKNRHVGLIICIACLFIFSACDRPQQGESLTIGYIHEPPYSYVSEQGVAKGIFPDAARKIAKKLNYADIKWVLMSFDNLLPALLDGRIDVIASGMTSGPLRNKLACFSVPLVTSRPAALWPKHIDTFDPNVPLANQNVMYAVVNGSIEAHYLKERMGEHRFMEIEDAYVGLYSIAQNKADVMLLTEPSLIYLADINPGQYKVDKIRMLPDNTHQIGFAFNKQNIAFVKRWNKAQLALMQSPSFIEGVSPYAFSLPTVDNSEQTTCNGN